MTDCTPVSKQEVIDNLSNLRPSSDECENWGVEGDPRYDQDDFWLNVVKKYWNPNVRFLTPQLAKKLIGKTICVVMGQWHHMVTKDFSRSKKISELGQLKIIRELVEGERFEVSDGYVIYSLGNILGTGTGCDPIMVFIKDVDYSWDSLPDIPPRLADPVEWFDTEMYSKQARSKTGKWFYSTQDTNQEGKITRVYDRDLLRKIPNQNPFTRKEWGSDVLARFVIGNVSGGKIGRRQKK